MDEHPDWIGQLEGMRQHREVTNIKNVKCYNFLKEIKNEHPDWFTVQYCDTHSVWNCKDRPIATHDRHQDQVRFSKNLSVSECGENSIARSYWFHNYIGHLTKVQRQEICSLYADIIEVR